LLPGSVACDLEHAEECVEVASVLQEETSIPVAATYADATNVSGHDWVFFDGVTYPQVAIVGCEISTSGLQNSRVSS
jgi:hypothetical protein